MSWTDDRVETLRQLWLDGRSASEISEILGGAITRNAVIGKVHRLGLAERKRGETAAAAAGRLAAAETKKAKSAQQRAQSAEAIAELKKMSAEERRAKALARGLAVIAKVDAEQSRARPVIVADNPGFVKLEPEPDLYSHLRSDAAYRAALAALTRPARTGSEASD